MSAYLSGADAAGRPVIYRLNGDTIEEMAQPTGTEVVSGNLVQFVDRAEIVPMPRNLPAKWWEVQDEAVLP